MILRKIKKEQGSALIICLVVMLFLGVLGILNFNSSKTELKMTSNIEEKTIKYQSAETALTNTAFELFKNEANLNKILQLKPSETVNYCIDKGAIINIGNKNCNTYVNDNNTIKSYSKTTVNKTSECLAYGNSNQKAHCYTIDGYGDIPLLKNEPSIHVQEIQINTINLNNNGVYEL